MGRDAQPGKAKAEVFQTISVIGAIGASAVLIASQHGASVLRGEQAPDCTLTASAPQRIALADGTTLTIDASSIARRGGEVLIAGTPTYLWGRGTRRGDSPLGAQEAFGVIRDARGRFTLVPAPPGVPGAKHPRVVSAGDGGWHAVFVTGKERRSPNPFNFADAEIWYGRYDGRRWRDVSRIARADAALLLPGMSSDLVIARSGLAFAYAFDHIAARRSNAHGNQGLVLLHRPGTEWREDTLHTRDAPGDIQLARDTAGAIVAAYALAYFADRRPHGPDLFTVRYDTGWSPPRVSVKVPSRYVAAPLVPELVRTGSVLAWRSAEAGVMGGRLEWGIVTPDYAIRQMGHVAATSISDRAAMVQVDRVGTVWLVRDGESKTSLRVHLLRDTTVHDLGAVGVPFDNPVLRAIGLADGTMLVVTGALGRSPSDPPASSYLTAITVRCTEARPSQRAIRVPPTQEGA